MRSHRLYLRPLIIALVAMLAGCGGDDNSTTSDASNGNAASNGKTDSTSGGDLEKALEGREDVVANFLREAADDKGVVPGDYQSVLDGIAEKLGCASDSQKTFVILMTRANFFPRNMFTVCSDDPQTASNFFLSTQSDTNLADIEPRDIKMYAWDSSANVYRLYEMKPRADGEGMQLEIEPGHCHSCHTGPTNLDNTGMPFTPIMNELVNPWTLWNAEPDFESHQFEDTIDAMLLDAPYYSAMTAEGRLDSASNFEKHVRAAIDRVTNAKLRQRRNDANTDESMALIRPMFCDETLNYVSENHFTGETHASAVIDDAIRRLYLTIRPDNWAWDWLNDGRLRLPIPEEGEEPIAVIPVRGEATLQVEVSLVNRRVLTAEQVLRVRALDWKRPVLSDFRCQLFLDAEARLKASPLDTSAYARNSDLIPVLYDTIMTLTTTDPDTGDTVTIDLVPPEGSALLSIPDVQETDAAYNLATGSLESFATTTDGFGEELEAYFKSAEEPGFRTTLDEARIERGCTASKYYPAAPLIPGTDACP